MLPRNFASNSSLDGMLAITWIPSLSQNVPSTTPDFISNTSMFLACFARILAGAVASVLETAIAVGPVKSSANASNSVPWIANFARVIKQIAEKDGEGAAAE